MNPDQKKQIEEILNRNHGSDTQFHRDCSYDAISALITQARIEELKMIIGIDEVWASPETKREHHRHRLAELNQENNQ